MVLDVYLYGSWMSLIRRQVRSVPAIGLLLLLICAPRCAAQQITIRVVNGKTGKAMKGLDVIANPEDARLYLGPFLGGEGTPQRSGPDGVVKFALSSPRPAYIFVTAGIPAYEYSCQRTPPVFSTTEVLQKGAIGQDSCDPSGKIRAKFKTEPGQITIFMRRLTFREKWCREMPLFCW